MSEFFIFLLQEVPHRLISLDVSSAGKLLVRFLSNSLHMLSLTLMRNSISIVVCPVLSFLSVNMFVGRLNALSTVELEPDIQMTSSANKHILGNSSCFNRKTFLQISLEVSFREHDARINLQTDPHSFLT